MKTTKHIQVKDKSMPSKTLTAIMNIAICGGSFNGGASPNLTRVNSLITEDLTPRKLEMIEKKLQKLKIDYSVIQEVMFEEA
jgi:hypothetical protein